MAIDRPDTPPQTQIHNLFVIINRIKRSKFLPAWMILNSDSSCLILIVNA